MKLFVLFFIALTSTSSMASELSWTVTGLTEGCLYGNNRIEISDDLPSSSCSVEGKEVTVIINGTAGYECDPIEEASLICCGDKMSCESVSLDRSDQDEWYD